MGVMSDGRPRLYSDLATWWPLFSPPSQYAEEAADVLPRLQAAADAPRTLLELGSGGGSLASHFKDHFQLTLTDRSEQMLEVSRRVNPDAEHVAGDMRTLDLGRQFDLVMIHDAIMYLTDEASLRAAFRTAFRHCRPGGGVVILPDCVTETFEAQTESGGEDSPDGRGLRYLEWVWDPQPDDLTYRAVFSFLLRERDGSVSVEMDQHEFGVFPRAAWLQWLREEGFPATSELDRWNRDIFTARKLLA